MKNDFIVNTNNMLINVDLHSHSGASGGVGDISFPRIFETMQYKGIDVYGSGDCLYPEWLESLQERFEMEDGLLCTNAGAIGSRSYSSCGIPCRQRKPQVLLQTELIFTIPYHLNPQKRKAWHNVVLFPDFDTAWSTVKLLDKYGVKNTIGRPFITCDSLNQLENFLFELKEINEWIEVIPAHVFTPQGIFGSTNPVNSLEHGYGKFTKNIHAVETGLSADPVALQMIPELDNLAFISNSDAHCGRLNRIGREFTQLEVEELSYKSIIDAIRENKVGYTTEFPMTEGRYFLTGHRERKNHPGWCCFSPQHVPESRLCPICNKPLTIGVLDRVLEVRDAQGGGEREWGKSYGAERNFKKLVPLVEVVARALEIKTITSKTVTDVYKKIIAEFATEAKLWESEPETIETRLAEKIDKNVLIDILQVSKGNFCFQPPGFDGEYGELQIGKEIDFWDISKVHLPKEEEDNNNRQVNLF